MVTLQTPRVLTGLALAGLVIVVVALLSLAPWSSSTAQALKQGDANCDQAVDAQDALADLRAAAGTEPAPACTAAGDVDCNGVINGADALAILIFSAGVPTLSPVAAAAACPPIGSTIDTPTPTQSAAPSTTPTRVPTITPTPTSSPSASAYKVTEVLSQGYLGPAANSAIDFVPIPGLPNEAIVALQSGKMYRVALDRSFAPTPWGDISGEVTHNNGDEQGLLSLAFSPAFQQDGRVYLYYTPGSPDPTILSRFQATPAGLNEASGEILIRVQEFAPNHNGSQIIFDNAGLLYFGVGDGGGGGDPNRRAQSLDTLLGKISRIDVSGPSGYTIPPSNPYSSNTKCSSPRYLYPTPAPSDNTSPCPEIFALGLRNPFRISHDTLSGQIWAGDVGQDNWEEVDHVTLGGNYGWSCMEGPATFNSDQCLGQQFTAPRSYYNHADGNQAITGGVIYRGSAMPELYGWYLYADFYSGNIWAVNTADNSAAAQLISHTGINISDFLLSSSGEVYMLSYSNGLYQLAPN